jgi:hypothetical protein
MAHPQRQKILLVAAAVLMGLELLQTQSTAVLVVLLKHLQFLVHLYPIPAAVVGVPLLAVLVELEAQMLETAGMETQAELLVLQTEVAVGVAAGEITLQRQTAALAALALSSLKYLTT